jgi:hypothetical protein
MSKKNVVTLLAFNAVVNALLINLRILHAITLNWWLVFLPTWFSMFLNTSKIIKDMLKHTRLPLKRE